MDDFSFKGFTSSSKFGENNENEIGSPKLQKPKKFGMKHFMEPTISAATKAALFPKKKILAERNEAFTFINSSKPPILYSRTSPVVSARSAQSSCSSDDEDEQNSFAGDSSLKKPYDPFTNYLSPRPKYLRYNPNKKRRIFLQGESEIIEKKNGLGVVSTSSSFESQKVVEEKTFEEGSVKEGDIEQEKTEGDPNDYDDEDAEEEEEEMEEFEEEEKCWSLLGLLKFLLVLGSLFLSTSYICSMNSPDPSLVQQAIREFRYGFLNQSNTHEVGTRNEYFASEFEVLGGKGEEARISLPDVTQEDIDVEFVEVGFSEVSRDDEEQVASTATLPEVIEVQIEKSEDVFDDGLLSKVEAFDDALHWADATESKTNTDVAFSGPEASSDQLSGSECRGNIIVSDQEMGGIQDGLDQLQLTETAEVTEEDLFSKSEASPDLNAEFEEMESEEIKLQLEVAALVVLFTIVPALCLLYYSRQRNTKEASSPTQKNSGEEASLPIETHQPNAELAHQIQNTNATYSVEEENVKKVEYFASPSTPLLPSRKVVSEEFSTQSQAPIVELLGELVIGEETSSFFRSSKMTRMPYSEERNASDSLSMQMMKPCSKTSLVQNRVYLTQLELSTADSPTSKRKKRPVKEESKSGEVSMSMSTDSTVTPVRRSSRIRNKAMSP